MTRVQTEEEIQLFCMSSSVVYIQSLSLRANRNAEKHFFHCIYAFANWQILQKKSSVA